jgi:alcohol dehydrogenase class IV
MQQFVAFTAMPRLIFGPGTVGRLGELAPGFGKTALVVTGAGSLERAGHLSRVTGDLQAAGMTVHHTRITGEPSPEMVDKVVALFRGRGIDVLIAIGGGSVLDGGKAVAAMLTESGCVADYLEGVGTQRLSGRSLPVIAVPTTSGTGSEATKNAVISRVGAGGFKKSLRHDNFIPKLAVLDPELCLSAPPSLTAACGMDALTQLIESYISKQAWALTDALARDGLRCLIPALPEACETGAADPICRGAMAYGAFLSGVTLTHAGLGVVHGVAGPMGGVLTIPHGVACANLLPYALTATVDNLVAADTAASRLAIDKLARIARLFGATSPDRIDCCRYLAAALYRLLDRLAVPRLKAFGLNAVHVDQLLAVASNKNNPVPLTADQMRRMILDRC